MTDLVSRLRKHARKFNVASDSESIANEAADRIEALERENNRLEQTRGDWTGKPCSVCKGSGEDSEARACKSCSGTGEEWLTWIERAQRAEAAFSGTVAPDAGLVEAMAGAVTLCVLVNAKQPRVEVEFQTLEQARALRDYLASHRSTPR